MNLPLQAGPVVRNESNQPIRQPVPEDGLRASFCDGVLCYCGSPLNQYVCCGGGYGGCTNSGGQCVCT
jgi:hypothetical protein